LKIVTRSCFANTNEETIDVRRDEKHSLRQVIFCLPAAILAAVAPVSARAADSDCAHALTRVTLRSDNDVLAGRDQGYSSGLHLKAATPDLRPGDERCLGAAARWLHEHLSDLSPTHFEQRNLVFGMGQVIATPSDPKRTDPVAGDRPYAGVIFFSAGYNARRGDELRSRELMIGFVGRPSLAQETQAFFHRVFGSERFRGWSNQLKNEPVFLFRQIESHRWMSSAPTLGVRWDAITRWGGAIGNLRSAAEVGVEWRFGGRLPDNFGSSPVRWGIETDGPIGPASPAASVGGQGGWHAFVSFNGSWVLRDITLDGNTWRSGPSVDRRALVGDAAVGVVLPLGDWKFSLARNYRTREFATQQPRPSWGSMSISRAL
jgi:lipid A 3-O-deacylase